MIDELLSPESTKHATPVVPELDPELGRGAGDDPSCQLQGRSHKYKSIEY
jgi:hypothetical protein